MVVNYLYGIRAGLSPVEANSVLTIDPDAVFPLPIPGQRLKAIPRRYLEFLKGLHGIQLVQFPPRNSPKCLRACFAGCFRVLAIKDIFGSRGSELPDHPSIIARLSCYATFRFLNEKEPPLCHPRLNCGQNADNTGLSDA